MEVINSKMRFVNIKDFYKKRILIKHYFNTLSLHDKCVYKLYVYSNRLEKEYKLDKVWEYLNEPVGSEYYVTDEMLKMYT